MVMAVWGPCGPNPVWQCGGDQEVQSQQGDVLRRGESYLGLLPCQGLSPSVAGGGYGPCDGKRVREAGALRWLRELGRGGSGRTGAAEWPLRAAGESLAREQKT